MVYQSLNQSTTPGIVFDSSSLLSSPRSSNEKMPKLGQLKVQHQDCVKNADSRTSTSLNCCNLCKMVAEKRKNLGRYLEHQTRKPKTHHTHTEIDRNSVCNGSYMYICYFICIYCMVFDDIDVCSQNCLIMFFCFMIFFYAFFV